MEVITLGGVYGLGAAISTTGHTAGAARDELEQLFDQYMTEVPQPRLGGDAVEQAFDELRTQLTTITELQGEAAGVPDDIYRQLLSFKDTVNWQTGHPFRVRAVRAGAMIGVLGLIGGGILLYYRYR